jgi:hypothetical protein
MSYGHSQHLVQPTTPSGSSISSTPSTTSLNLPITSPMQASGGYPGSAPSYAESSTSFLPGTSRSPSSGKTPRQSTRLTRAHEHSVLSHPVEDSTDENARIKKKQYAKQFRDKEKQLFEKLRRRLFPQDPTHAKREELLERGEYSVFYWNLLFVVSLTLNTIANHNRLLAIDAIDEHARLKARERQRSEELEQLRQQLAVAEDRAHQLLLQQQQSQSNVSAPSPFSPDSSMANYSQSGMPPYGTTSNHLWR